MSVSCAAFIAHAPTGPKCTGLTFLSEATDAPEPEATGASVP